MIMTKEWEAMDKVGFTREVTSASASLRFGVPQSVMMFAFTGSENVVCGSP
jgi:hypothetical protein